MQTVVDVLKMTVRPTSVTFLLVVLAPGVALALIRRTERIGRWYFVAVFLGYWICSTPACAERLVVWSGGDAHPIMRVADAGGARTVVILSAGNQTLRVGDLTLNLPSLGTAFRVMEGARLYRLLDRPTIILSGGITGTNPGARSEAEAMRNVILTLGVPADHVVLETESRNTREEALVVRRMLADRAGAPIVLVTSPTHMQRSMDVFRLVGLNPVPSTSAYKSDGTLESRRWLPNDVGLLLFSSFVYDSAATVYYRLKGWRAD
jgi:uncharacterized SAM-binding protein YcdF (DUF218 family)